MKFTFLPGAFVAILCYLAGTPAASQVSVSADGAAPHSSAMLEVKSTGKGFLPPRINLQSVTDVTTVANPAEGLLIYNTNPSITNGCGTGYYYYCGTKWMKLAAGTTHYIGEQYGGGKIFWLDETGEHGLIAAVQDQGNASGTVWYNQTYKITGASADGVFAGEHNTAKIIASQGTGTYAASLCNDLVLTVNNIAYSDWYLPSKYELNIMYGLRTLIGGFNYSYGIYWSSTEGTVSPLNNAFEQEFINGSGSGYVDEGQKNWPNQVRCIRKF
jgi:hypothetical protein